MCLNQYANLSFFWQKHSIPSMYLYIINDSERKNTIRKKIGKWQLMAAEI